jgi:hypothetical protein
MHIFAHKKIWPIFRCENDVSTFNGLCLVTRVQLSLHSYLPCKWYNLAGDTLRKFTITEVTKDVL